jgi:hypothetical protein
MANGGAEGKQKGIVVAQGGAGLLNIEFDDSI